MSFFPSDPPLIKKRRKIIEPTADDPPTIYADLSKIGPQASINDPLAVAEELERCAATFAPSWLSSQIMLNGAKALRLLIEEE